jgi:DNA-binding CsgD family transcriptional regulator
MSETAILDLVGFIDDAAAAARAWPVFLTALARATGDRIATIDYHDARDASGSLAAQVGLDPGSQKSYDEYYRTLNPWLNQPRVPTSPGTVATTGMMFPEEELIRSEYYNEFLAPQDIFRGLGAIIDHSASAIAAITMLRPKRRGDFASRDVALLRSLVPHLQRAFQFHRRFALLESQRRSLGDALDLLPAGVFLLGEGGALIVANAAAQRLLDENDGLMARRDGRAAAGHAERTALRGLIRAAAQTAQGQGMSCGGVMAISRPSGRRPYMAMVAPVRSRRFALDGPVQPIVAVVVTDPEREDATPTELLTGLFGLTPAEARLAALLAEGKSVAEAAAELRVSLNTVRTHLKRVLSKTGTRGQADLVRLILTSPTRLRPR